jgi:hypothetical protein
MSVENVMARIAALQQGLLAPGTAAPATADGSAFAATLRSASSTVGAAPTPVAAVATAGVTGMTGTAATPGQRALQLAQAEVGQAEQPPGSNDSPRIAEYRTATAGSGVGPWCAYFVSWAAQQAGVPLGEAGQGFGSVSAVASWAQRTGRWNAAASGLPPQPGDLIVWGGQHIGIVESVDADGSIHTVEGNSSNMVTRRTHDATGDGATGYVRLG